jgi:hypothetical protein
MPFFVFMAHHHDEALLTKLFGGLFKNLRNFFPSFKEKLTDLIQHSLDKNVPISHITSIVGEINLAITKRAIELAIDKIGVIPLPAAKSTYDFSFSGLVSSLKFPIGFITSKKSPSFSSCRAKVEKTPFSTCFIATLHS